jgi:hypothetical protein
MPIETLAQASEIKKPANQFDFSDFINLQLKSIQCRHHRIYTEIRQDLINNLPKMAEHLNHMILTQSRKLS